MRKRPSGCFSYNWKCISDFKSYIYSQKGFSVKKNYQTPKMKVVQLKHRAMLLEGSDLYHGPGGFNLPVESPTDAKA